MAPDGTSLLEPPQTDAGPEGGGGGGGAGGGGAGGAGDALQSAVSTAADVGAKGAAGGLALVGGVVLLPFIVVVCALAVLVGLIASFGGGTGDDSGNGVMGSVAGIPAVYQPMYELASETYSVNAYLLASIHKQETDFSRNPAAQSGQNQSGASGPMQFLHGTWTFYNKAFVPVEDRRPKSYPLNRAQLASCKGVPSSMGCIYDDFDAIMAAADKLHHDGADMNLKSAGTHRAVCAYIGSCGEVDKCTGSINEYCEVLPNAIKWEIEGGSDIPGDGSAASKAVAWALTQQGVVEKPKGSNCGGPITGWQRDAGRWCGVAWCGTFVLESYLHAGIKLPTSYLPSVAATWDHIKQGDGPLHVVSKANMKVGDVLIFQWDSGVPDHMGLVAKPYDGGGSVHTIEGNTSDGVYARTRNPSEIEGVGRLVSAK